MKKNFSKNTILLFVLGFILSGCFFPFFPETSTTNAYISKPVGISSPPIQNNASLRFSIKQMQALNMDLIRIGSSWEQREPHPGEYYWKPLDERISALDENGVSIMFTIPASGPDWVCSEKTEKGTCVFQDDDAFRTYLTALLTRYKGKIAKVQFGNEWDNLSWYPGTAQEFVHFNNILFDVVRKVAPEMQVVLGGLTSAYPISVTVCEQGNTLSFESLDLKPNVDLAAQIQRQVCSRSDLPARVEHIMENASYDLIDLHLYDLSAYWPEFVDIVRELSDKPLIVSEFGGPSSSFERYSHAYQANRLEDYLLTIQSLPIEEAYYFNLVDNPTTYHSHSGLFTILRLKKDAFYVMQNMLASHDN